MTSVFLEIIEPYEYFIGLGVGWIIGVCQCWWYLVRES